MSDTFDWFDELTPEHGFGKAFLEYIKSEESKDKIVNPEKLKEFLESAKNIKKYFKQNTTMFKFNIPEVNKSLNLGQITVEFEHLNLVDSADLRKLADKASYIEFTIKENNMPEIIFGFRDFMKELK